MINIIATSPVELTNSHYIDDSIKLTVDQEIESGSLDVQYFMLWKTNSGYTGFLNQISIKTIEYVDGQIIISPTMNFEQNAFYMLIVVGGADGIKSTTGETLLTNFILKFQASSLTNPGPVIPGPIDAPGDVVDNPNIPGTNDTLTIDETKYSIFPIMFVPANESVGIRGINQISIKFDDIINILPSTANVVITRNVLPIDPDPFANHTVAISDITKINDTLIIDNVDIPDEINYEYKITIKAGSMNGMNRDFNKEIVVRYMSPLTPLYATPEQIKSRLSGFVNSNDVPISDYDLYKLILEKSIYARTVYGVDDTGDNLIRLNRMVICMVLRELFTSGNFLNGSAIKSRELLMTKVEYYNNNIKDVLKDLDNCIEENIPVDPSGNTLLNVRIGVKSYPHLDRPAKIYKNAYR